VAASPTVSKNNFLYKVIDLVQVLKAMTKIQLTQKTNLDHF
jgi:hypothetical protein